MKGEVKGAKKIDNRLMEGSEKTATPHYHFYKTA